MKTDSVNYVSRPIEWFYIEQNKNGKSSVYVLTQRMLAYNSNRMERSVLREVQVAFLFETGMMYADEEIIRAKDIEEMTGYFSMFMRF